MLFFELCARPKQGTLRISSNFQLTDQLIPQTPTQ